MSRIGTEYTLGAAVVAGVVAASGGLMVGESGWAAVGWGSVIAFVVQVAVFWVLFVWLLPTRWGLAHGMGALVRLGAVVWMALVWVPASGYAPAPTLFSFVACLFGSTLIEPVILKRQHAAPPDDGMAALRTES